MIVVLIMLAFVTFTNASQNVGRPVLQQIPVPNEVLAGQKFKLGCTMSSGELPVTFKWFKDEQLIESNEAIVIRNGLEDYSELIVRQISLKDKGKYKCVVRNSNGEDQSQVDVKVKGTNYNFK